MKIINDTKTVYSIGANTLIDGGISQEKVSPVFIYINDADLAIDFPIKSGDKE